MRANAIRLFVLILTALLLLSSCGEKKEKDEAKKDTGETDNIKETEEMTEGDTEDVDSLLENVEVEKTYLISTKEELDAVRHNLAGSYRLLNDIVFEKEDFEEGGAFYNGGRGWQSIGDNSFPFTGSFDGNGFTIYNLYINIDEKTETQTSIYGSLFGRNDGVIENLSVYDCDISVKADSGPARCGVYAAAVAGNNIGVVQNCCVTGSIKAELTSSNEKVFTFAGGICGNSFTVKGCRNEADVSSYITMTVDAETARESETANQLYVSFCYAGGIAGTLQDAEGCVNTGNIRAVTAAHNSMGLVYDSSYAGGIAADLNSSRITRCHNFGRIEASSLGSLSYAGGIAGNALGGEITRSSNRGAVSASTEAGLHDKGARAGGICGSGELKIVDCYNCGSINAKTVANPENIGETAGLTYVGGICAGTVYEMQNCYNTGDINMQSGCDYSCAGAIAPQDIPAEAVGICYLDTYPVGAVVQDHAVRCTAQQMKSKEIFEGYDFETVWEIDSNGDYPYPTLR